MLAEEILAVLGDQRAHEAALRAVELSQARVAALAAIETDDAPAARALALELLPAGT